MSETDKCRCWKCGNLVHPKPVALFGYDPAGGFLRPESKDAGLPSPDSPGQGKGVGICPICNARLVIE